MSETVPTMIADNACAVCIQGGDSTSANSNGGGTKRISRTPSTASTGMRSHSPRISAAKSDWRAFDGDRTGALAASPSFASGQGASLICIQDGQANGGMENDMSTTLNASHEQPIVCMADDNAHSAIDDDVCGSLKVGGGVPMVASAPSARGTGKASVRRMSSRES